MSAIRIFPWESVPLPWRLLLQHLTGDTNPRTHLALVPATKRTQWETPPVSWTDLQRLVIDDPAGLEMVEPGDELIAGNEVTPPLPRDPVEPLRPSEVS